MSFDRLSGREESSGAPTPHGLGSSHHDPGTLADLNAKVSDATLIDTGDSRLSDARTPTAHSLAGAEHSTSTLAALNGKISDATLIDTGDARLSDERVPTDLSVTNAKVSATAAIVESKLALSFPTHSSANDPAAGEKAALAGTSGTPGAGNKYVTDGDARMSDARTPTAHTHDAGDVATGTLAAARLPAATDAAQGAVELATQAEVNTGTDTTRAVTPATLKGSTNIPGASAKDVQACYGTDANPYVKKNPGTAYEAYGRLIFRGTSTLGTPTGIIVMKNAETASPTHSIRIYDLTNAQVIAEVTGLADVGLVLLNMGTLSNLPTGMATLEVQGKRDAAGSVGLRVSCVQVQF